MTEHQSPQSIDRHLLQRLEPTESTFARDTELGGEVVAIGPFRAVFSRDSDNEWLDQVVPFEPLGASDEVAGWLHLLRRLFVDRHRRLNLEFNEPLWPRLPMLLDAAGFLIDAQEPIMVCARGDFRPTSHPRIVVRFMSEQDADAPFVAYRHTSEVMEVDRGAPEVVRREMARWERSNRHVAGAPVGPGASVSGRVAEIAREATGNRD